MLGLPSPQPIVFPTPCLPLNSKLLPLQTRLCIPAVPKVQPQNSKQFRINAEKNDGRQPTENAKNGGSVEEEKGKNGLPRLNMRLVDLVLDPDPDNIVAVGLTGLLTWASVQVLWQLLVISAAILIAALKYSIVAALLIFILITLL